MIRAARIFPIAPLLAGLVFAGCSSTRVEGTWMHPSFGGRTIVGPVLVTGVMRDETVRRTYEDGMAAALAARGIVTVKSYDVVAGELEGKPDPVVEAARDQGARYLLSTAVVGRSTKTVVYNDPPTMIGYGGWYSRNWGVGVVGPTTIRQYDVFAAETSLVEVATDRIEWTVRTRSTAGSDIAADVHDFVDAILIEMTKAALLPPAD